MKDVTRRELALEAVHDPAPRTPARSAGEALRGYFVALEHRPDGVREIDVTRLTRHQRALLVNDGTVTRLLEASILELLDIEVLDQQTITIAHEEWLDLPVTPAPVLRRRVAIRGRASGRL